MGLFFDTFLTGWNQGRKRARRESYRMSDKSKIPVKLVKPSTGRVVELLVTESNEQFAKLYMSQLTAYAEELERNGAQYEVIGNKVRIEFTSGGMAEIVRQQWR